MFKSSHSSAVCPTTIYRKDDDIYVYWFRLNCRPLLHFVVLCQLCLLSSHYGSWIYLRRAFMRANTIYDCVWRTQQFPPEVSTRPNSAQPNFTSQSLGQYLSMLSTLKRTGMYRVLELMYDNGSPGRSLYWRPERTNAITDNNCLDQGVLRAM
jgi:hypothetical protein